METVTYPLPVENPYVDRTYRKTEIAEATRGGTIVAKTELGNFSK